MTRRSSRDVYRRAFLMCRKCGKQGFITSHGLNEHIRKEHVRASVKAAYGASSSGRKRKAKKRRTDVYRRPMMQCACGKRFLTGKSFTNHQSKCSGKKRRKGKRSAGKGRGPRAMYFKHSPETLRKMEEYGVLHGERRPR